MERAKSFQARISPIAVVEADREVLATAHEFATGDRRVAAREGDTVGAGGGSVVIKDNPAVEVSAVVALPSL